MGIQPKMDQKKSGSPMHRHTAKALESLFHFVCSSSSHAISQTGWSDQYKSNHSSNMFISLRKSTNSFCHGQNSPAHCEKKSIQYWAAYVCVRSFITVECHIVLYACHQIADIVRNRWPIPDDWRESPALRNLPGGLLAPLTYVLSDWLPICAGKSVEFMNTQMG